MRYLLVVLLSQHVGINSLQAGWRELKPIFGGRVDRIAVEAGGALWAVTPGGIYRSADNAAHWASAVGNLPVTSITAIATDPAVAGVVYAGTAQGLYRTTDAGVTWSQLPLTLPGGIRIQEMAVAPSNRNAIYVATWGDYLWRSLDFGATWVKLTSGLSGGSSGPAFLTSIAIDPGNSNRAYTSTWRGLIFRSDDAGNSWTAVGGGTFWNGQIVISPSSTNVLYTTHDETWNGRGTILKSTDSGNSWSNAGRPAGPSDASQLAIDPTNPNIVYVTSSLGVHKTTSGGGTWNPSWSSSPALQAMNAIAVRPNDSTQVFAGGYYQGVQRSLNAGQTWTAQSQGIAGAQVIGIEICRDVPSTIYAGAIGAGYLKSTDGGSTWQSLGMQDHEVHGLGVSPQDPNILVASSYDGTSSRTWRTTDGGLTFTTVAPQFASNWYRFSPHDPNRVNSSVSDWMGGFIASLNAGASWFTPTSMYIYPGNYDFHPTFPNVVFSVGNRYVGAANNRVHVLWSNASGSSGWTAGAEFGGGNFVDLALDKNDPTTLYVAGSIPTEGTQGVYKFSLVYSGNNLSTVNRVTGVFNSGLTNTLVRRLHYDRATSTLYASTSSGVFRSKNGAASWESISQGLPYLSTNILATPPNGQRLLVGTNGGIWEFVDNRPPVANPGSYSPIAADASCRGVVTLDGSASSDPDGDPLTFAWTGPFGSATGVRPQVTLPLGSSTISLTVSDGKGGTSSTSTTITVIDSTAPVISAASATPGNLWPANHKMVPVTVTVSASDGCSTSVTCRIVSVTSNEPIEGLGDGDTSPDWVITGNLAVDLRAERAGNGSGRIYTITVRCTDAAGNASARSVLVTVPHDGGRP